MVRQFTITIDTNCINTKQGKETINQIEKWHDKGLVEIVKTDVMDTEFVGAHPKFKKKSQKYHEDLGVGVWGHSRWDHFLWGGENMNYPLEKIRDLLFPRFQNLKGDAKKRAIRDAMHLATHYMCKRDFFVTEDKNFVKKRNRLEKVFRVKILTPNECIEKLKPLISN